MAKMYCPKCGIHRFMVKNDRGEGVVVVVSRDLEILPVDPDVSLAGYDLSLLFCLGCSWKGSPQQLKRIPS